MRIPLTLTPPPLTTASPYSCSELPLVPFPTLRTLPSPVFWSPSAGPSLLGSQSPSWSGEAPLQLHGHPSPDVPSSCLQGPVGHGCHRILGLGFLFLSLRSSSCILSLGPGSAIVPCKEWGCRPSQESCSLPGDIQLLGVLCLPYQHLETNEGLQGAFSDHEIIWLHYGSRKRGTKTHPGQTGK